MKNPKNLPEEILIEIFSKLSTKSVGRCRCLSKSWRTHLSTPQFVKLHLTRKPNTPTDFIFTSSSKDTYLHVATIPFNDGNVSRRLVNMPDNGYTVITSCNGLILLLCGRRLEILVLNPITLQRLNVKLEGAHRYLSFLKYGFGYDSRFDDYKIVKITPCRGESPTFVDVYALKEGAWRRLGNYPYSHGFVTYSNVVFVNGAVHWLAMRIVDKHVVIVALDLVTESFREIPAPSVYKLVWQDLFAIGGCLILLGPGHTDVGVMKEYGQVKSWTGFSFSATDTLRLGRVTLTPMCFIGGNEVVFLTSDGSLIVGNLIEGTIRYMPVAGSMDHVRSGCTFVDALSRQSSNSL